MTTLGKHFSAKTRLKMSLAHIGKKYNVDHEKRSLSCRGRIPWNKGRTKETDSRIAKIKVKNRELWIANLRNSYANGRKPWNYGLTKEIDGRVMRLALLNKSTNHTKKAVEASVIARKGKPGKPASEHRKQAISKTLKGRPGWSRGLTKETDSRIVNISVAVSKLWENPDYRQNWLSKTLETRHKHPNNAESQLLNLLNEYFPNEWEYIGNGKLIINGLCPDFANINGKKKLIEHFGDYWHNRKGMAWHQTEEGRIATYKEIGYDCLIIWENELKEPGQVKIKIENFIKT